MEKETDMTTRKSLATVTAVTVMLAGMLVLATPAGAKKPQPPPPTLYQVTISGSLSTGDAGCTADAVLIMRDQDGHLVADGSLGTSVPRLVFEAALPWSRLYPEAAGDQTGFHGCHGGAMPGSMEGSNGYLYLYRQNGEIVGLMWAFDWYTGTVLGPGRQPKPREVREYFRTWNTTGLQDGTATFVITYYGPSGITEIGTTNLSFTITSEQTGS
jgi:hypothetical protein